MASVWNHKRNCANKLKGFGPGTFLSEAPAGTDTPGQYIDCGLGTGAVTGLMAPKPERACVVLSTNKFMVLCCTKLCKI